MNRPNASAPTRARRNPTLAERLLRGIAVGFLNFFLFYLKVLVAVVRFGLGAVKKTRKPDAPSQT